MFDLASIVTYVAVVIGLFLIPGPAVLLGKWLFSNDKTGLTTGCFWPITDRREGQ